MIQTISQPYRIEGGDMVLDFHEGQWKAWDSEARFVVVLAGTQGGKTSFGPHWLYREIQRKGPGDYLVVTPTYKLLDLKALPEFKKIFEHTLNLGEYKVGAKVFVFSEDGERRTWDIPDDENVPAERTRVIFGYAADEDSLESATAKAAWLDEAGQTKFKLASYEAIMRRLSLAQGRLLITTTPYNLGWLKQKLWDRRNEDEEIEVFRFDSTMNPAFPQEEMDRARRDLPLWKFNMYYRALFTRPAGMIYDCYEPERHKIDPFDIPEEWPRYVGVDFGGVNTAAVFLAKSPKGTLYAYREYFGGSRTAAKHAELMLAGEPRLTSYGGAKSEGQWRQEFGAAGMFVNKPMVADVEVGIDRVYGAINNNYLFFSKD